MKIATKVLRQFLLFLSVMTLQTAFGAKYSINVADFSRLSVDNGVKVIYSCVPDSAGFVVFDCEPDLASKIILMNNKSTLRVQVDIDESLPTGLPVVKAYSSTLSAVSNSGDSLVVVNLATPCDRFVAKVIGNGAIEVKGINAGRTDANVTAGRGYIKLDGKSDKVKLFIAGTGHIEARNLDAREVYSKSFGPGKVVCNPSSKLYVAGLNGRIYYVTEPEEISRRGMGVKALPLDSIND
ncbi:MAG: DUF2807 domain-containing protein [Muribaculaceae bacterium]|nr:DUF2807 domain-containing protein [Muribaculaceae bacterium]